MKKTCITLFSLLILFLQSCLPDELPTPSENKTTDNQIENLQIPSNFDFATTGIVTISIEINDNQDKPMAGVPFSIHLGNQTQPLILSGITAANGTYSVRRTIAKNTKKLVFKTDFIGIPQEITVSISNGKAVFEIGGSKPKTTSYVQETNALLSARTEATSLGTIASFKTLGTWTSSGVPRYLESQNDVISTDFLRDITASLPEGSPLTQTHPDYLTNDKPTTLQITKRADVWITFVHEGAGWQNSLGFYTYDPQNPPKSISDLQNITMVFPNVSFAGSGGGLVSGNKVKIGTFDAGTSIGFFLIGNAFSNGNVGSGYYAHFSHSNLNVETNPALKRHAVVLDDSKSNRILLSFEDVSRENKPIGCDNDFNDAIFFITSNPIEAIDVSTLSKMDTFEDTDNDGVGDTRDEYPTDPLRAFNAFTPSKTGFSTIAYEDLWPAKGDYDFNDLVVNYQFQEVLNSKNQVVEIKLKSVVKAIGASYKNAWAFQMDAAPSVIKRISGQSLKQNLLSLANNNTENGQSKAVIFVFDNAFDVLKRSGSEFINTVTSQPYTVPDTLRLTVELTTPTLQSALGTPPYNLFLFANQERGREVHLTNFAPTDKANKSLFGTSHDRSNISKNVYYKNWKNLPWAIEIPENFDYPIEKTELLNAYPNFRNWAESGGSTNTDWYTNTTANRNSASIYKK